MASDWYELLGTKAPGQKNRIDKSGRIFPEYLLQTFSDYSSEVWISQNQTYPKVYRNMFRVKPRANLGLDIFFTVLILKSEKQWKVLSVCLKNLP